METKIQFGGAGRDYKLTSAILIYTGPGGDDAHGGRDTLTAATVHDVEHIGRGQPIIQPGQPVSVQALERLLLSLGRQQAAGFLPETMLAVGLDLMAWWCPAGRRRIWFKTYKEDDKELRALNGKFVHHPPLLFIVKGGLNVFALVEDKRPRAGTKLWRAPYWNLGEGHMCNGNLKLPPCQPENLAGFEAAFFNSAFTHGRGQGLTTHPGGHTAFWRELSRRKAKPDAAWWRKKLLPAKQKVADFIARHSPRSQPPQLEDDDDDE